MESLAERLKRLPVDSPRHSGVMNLPTLEETIEGSEDHFDPDGPVNAYRRHHPETCSSLGFTESLEPSSSTDEPLSGKTAIFRKDRVVSEIAVDCKLLACTLSELLRDQLRAALREEIEQSDILKGMRNDCCHIKKRLQDLLSPKSDPSPSHSIRQSPHDSAGSDHMSQPVQDPCEELFQILRTGPPSWKLPKDSAHSAQQAMYLQACDTVSVTSKHSRVSTLCDQSDGCGPRAPPPLHPQLSPVLPPGGPPRLIGMDFGSSPMPLPLDPQRAAVAAPRLHQASFSSNYSAPAVAMEAGGSNMRAHMIGAERAASNHVWAQRPRRRLPTSSRGVMRLSDLEKHLDVELFRANNLLEDDEVPERKADTSSFSRGNWWPGRKSKSQQKSVAPSPVGGSFSANLSLADEASAASPSGSSHVVPGNPSFQGGDPNCFECEKAEDKQLAAGGEALGNVYAADYRNPGEPPSGDGSSDNNKEDPKTPDWLVECNGHIPSCQMLLQMQQQRELTENLELNFEIDGALFVSLEKEKPTPLKLFIRRVMRIFASKATPAIGLLPWSYTYIWASTLYQYLVIGGLCCCVAYGCREAVVQYEADDSAAASVLVMDSILALGALAGLLGVGAYRRSASLATCGRLLKAYSKKVGAQFHWQEVSQVDFVAAVCLWSLANLGRAQDNLINLEPPTAIQGCFAVSTAVLIGISSYFIHICRALVKMSDTFCYHFVESPDFGELVQQWSLLQSLVRAACKSIQVGFVALQATVTAAGLLSITQATRLEFSRILGLVPSLLIACAVIRTCVWAAAVTDKCTRIPMLINSVSVGNSLDPDRMYCVQHIVHSQAGFYLFELRVTSATIFKTIYVACAMAFGVATQVLV